MKILPLGAGQDVGKSCILISLGNKNVMLDCGMHMGFNDERRFPDFSYLTCIEPLDCAIDCVLITHFHLDHCGALPYMTEVVGYNGPIYMSYPTKAICPVLLRDFWKITKDRGLDNNFFKETDIPRCMSKVETIRANETIEVIDGLKIKAYYAGHVLGAVMFLVEYDGEKCLYTGDYNMTPDRHLGPARVDRCKPDVLITESTYATTVRGSRHFREREFIEKVRSTIQRGGKVSLFDFKITNSSQVLIPCFALGRAQELCILLESYWNRNNINVPISFSTGLTSKAIDYYKMFTTWTNENIQVRGNGEVESVFDFKHITAMNMSDQDNILESPNPAVIFATPGMLHAGASLRIFKKLAPDYKNMVILPGYCVSGTIGDRIIKGAKSVDVEGENVKVELTVEYLSFSAHADAKGIIQLIEMVEPRHVVFVHGEKQRMKQFINHLSVHVNFANPFRGPEAYHTPANGQMITIDPEEKNEKVHVKVSTKLLNNQVDGKEKNVEGVIVMQTKPTILPLSDFISDNEEQTDFTIKFTSKFLIFEETESEQLFKQQVVNVLRFKEKFEIKEINNVNQDDWFTFQINNTSVIITLSPPLDEPIDNRITKAFPIRVEWEIENDELGEHMDKIIKNSFNHTLNINTY